MKENIKAISDLLAIVLFLVFLVWVSVAQIEGEKNQIVAYCARHGQSVEKTESPFFSHGPYWYQKGDRIYRTVAESEHGKENTYWFRFRVWRTPAVEREEVNGDYTELDFNE